MLNDKDRRRFLKLLPYTMAGVFAYPASKFIFFSVDIEKEFQISLKNIKDGITKIKKHDVFIYKKENSIKVLDAHCTHMGCILNYYEDKKEFICPCHHSHFTMDGKRIKGPAKRNLDKIPFKIKNQTLFIG